MNKSVAFQSLLKEITNKQVYLIIEPLLGISVIDDEDYLIDGLMAFDKIVGRMKNEQILMTKNFLLTRKRNVDTLGYLDILYLDILNKQFKFNIEQLQQSWSSKHQTEKIIGSIPGLFSQTADNKSEILRKSAEDHEREFTEQHDEENSNSQSL